MKIAALSLWAVLTGAPDPLILASTGGCARPTALPAVAYNFQSTPPQVTHNLDFQGLSQFSVDTVFARHTNEVFLKAGITQGFTKINHSAAFRYQQDPVSNTICMYVDKIDVVVSYEPVVHIASNFPYGSCRFKTTWEHELRHVNTDLITLTEYGGHMKQAAAYASQSLGAIGPFPVTQLEAQQQAVMGRIGTVIDKALDDIGTVRMQRQQLIDTREEYMRVSRACPNEPLR